MASKVSQVRRLLTFLKSLSEHDVAKPHRVVKYRQTGFIQAVNFSFRRRPRPVTNPAWQPNSTIGFLGAGKMATALAKGFVNAEMVFPREIIASDPHATCAKHFAAERRRRSHRRQPGSRGIRQRSDPGHQAGPGGGRAGGNPAAFHPTSSAHFHRRRGDALPNWKRLCPPGRGSSA